MSARRFLFAVGASLLLLTGAVAAEPTLNRSQALQRLSHADAEKRREALVRLGEVGAMADAKALVDELRDSDEDARVLAEDALWKIWSRSGDQRTDSMYELGTKQMAQGLAPDAIETFTRIIKERPGFAEAWNKRATIYFLIGEYDKSLADCDEVMKRNPYHFGALAGYFQIYLQLEDYERALKFGYRALGVNPNMEGVRQGVAAVEKMLGRNRQTI